MVGGRGESFVLHLPLNLQKIRAETRSNKTPVQRRARGNTLLTVKRHKTWLQLPLRLYRELTSDRRLETTTRNFETYSPQTRQDSRQTTCQKTETKQPFNTIGLIILSHNGSFINCVTHDGPLFQHLFTRHPPPPSCPMSHFFTLFHTAVTPNFRGFCPLPHPCHM